MRQHEWQYAFAASILILGTTVLWIPVLSVPLWILGVSLALGARRLEVRYNEEQARAQVEDAPVE